MFKVPDGVDIKLEQEIVIALQYISNQSSKAKYPSGCRIQVESQLVERLYAGSRHLGCQQFGISGAAFISEKSRS